MTTLRTFCSIFSISNYNMLTSALQFFLFKKSKGSTLYLALDSRKALHKKEMTKLKHRRKILVCIPNH
jgi:hypothetical protein